MPSYPSTLTGWTEIAPPPIASRVYFAYKLVVPNRNGGLLQIGTIQNFSPSSSRQVQRIRGIANNGAWPFELAPGAADTTIAVNYLSLYLLPLAKVFGYPVASSIDLNYQRIPFDIQELCFFPNEAEANLGTKSNLTWTSDQWKKMASTSGMAVETLHYKGCLISNMSRTINQGTVTIAETATIQVTWTGFEDTKAGMFGQGNMYNPLGSVNQ